MRKAALVGLLAAMGALMLAASPAAAWHRWHGGVFIDVGPWWIPPPRYYVAPPPAVIVEPPPEYVQQAPAAGESAASGATIGTVLGAALGAAFGAAAGNPGIGAAVGAGTGLLGGTVVGADTAEGAAYEVQHRYDMAYMQCMYSKGNQIPVARGSLPAYTAISPGPADVPPPPPPGRVGQ